MLFVLSLGNSKPLKFKGQMPEGTHQCLLTPCPGCPRSNSTQRPRGTSPARSWTFGKLPGAWKEKQPPVKSPGRPIDNNKASPVFPSRICTARMSAEHKATTKPFRLLVATGFRHDADQCFSRLTSLLNAIFLNKYRTISLQTDFWPFLSRYTQHPTIIFNSILIFESLSKSVK